MQLDLNLLTALDALLEEGSVGGAADRLHLSAPAMSRTLSRIRRTTGDEILVRTGRRMTPTPYALRVRAQVHALVGEVQAVLAPEREVDLAVLARTFTLQCHDAVTAAVGPWLLEMVQRSAPGVTLQFLPEAAVDTLDLRHGKVDLEIGSAAPEQAELSSAVLAEDELVLAMRRSHALAGQRITVRRYCQARHITVSRRGRTHDLVDDLLSARGWQRTVVASAPSSTAALQFVRQNDLVTIVARRMCAPTLEALDLHVSKVPLPLPPSPLVASWHQRYDNDGAHRWLRRVVSAAVDRALTRGDTTHPSAQRARPVRAQSDASG